MDVANPADAPAQARTRPDQRTGPDVVVGVAHPVYLRLLTEVLGESTPAGG